MSVVLQFNFWLSLEPNTFYLLLLGWLQTLVHTCLKPHNSAAMPPLLFPCGLTDCCSHLRQALPEKRFLWTSVLVWTDKLLCFLMPTSIFYYTRVRLTSFAGPVSCEPICLGTACIPHAAAPQHCLTLCDTFWTSPLPSSSLRPSLLIPTLLSFWKPSNLLSMSNF